MAKKRRKRILVGLGIVALLLVVLVALLPTILNMGPGGTPIEFKLLRLFMERPGQVLTREELLEAVWGVRIHVEKRTVDVHIRRLRLALAEYGSRDLIRTVRTVGYALNGDDACDPEGPLTHASSAAEPVV